jgi:hypothetical protein
MGDFFGSEVMWNDYVLIDELRGLGKTQRLAKLNALGDEAARFLEGHARRALDRWRHVLVVAHVRPDSIAIPDETRTEAGY